MALVALKDLDQLLALRQSDAELAARLRQPLDLEAFLALAADYGCSVTEADVLEAQQREQSARSAEDLQHEQAGESRRLRSFIQG